MQVFFITGSRSMGSPCRLQLEILPLEKHNQQIASAKAGIVVCRYAC